MSSNALPRLLVIYNPIAGRRRQRFLSRVIEAMERRGASIRLEPTNARGHAEAMARAAAIDAGPTAWSSRAATARSTRR